MYTNAKKRADRKIDFQINAYLNSDDFKKDSSYWKKHLSDVGEFVKFHRIPSNNYNNIIISLENETLGEFLNQYDVSKFYFITAVFALYLSRVDRTRGCLLKTTISNDDFDISTILKIELIKENSFIDYMNEIKDVFNLADEHTKVNIDNYVDGDLSYYSIYDFTGCDDAEVYDGDVFSLNVCENSLNLIYNADLFSEIFINHMAENISSLIDNVLNSPHQQCGNIDILSTKEKDLLSDFSKGKTIDVDKNKTLAMEFRENAQKYPDFIAIDDGINQVSYASLESSSNSLAYDLSTNYDIGLGDCVGLMLPRSYHFPELVLSLNKIGALFTAIDPNYPLKRIEHMLNISESTHIITTKEYAKNTDFNVEVVYVEDLNRDYDESIECLGNENDLFAIFFTSGTTGLPKGVMVSNRQLKGVATAFKEIFKTSPGDVMGYFASFSFIAAIRMYLALIFGECCRIFNEREQKDSLLLINALKKQEMSDIILPPALGTSILDNEDIKLKYMILGGSKLDGLANKKTNTQLVNLYASTEMLLSVVNIFDVDDIEDNVPIGSAVPNTWAYILDDEGMQLPVGVPGEICISNDYLSPGYYNRPDLTDKVFVDNPLSTCEDNKRLYRTGDIGFYNFDGKITVMGREDAQLSVRGFRIESGEILNIMKGFKGISDICLDVEYDTLIAYYVTDDDLDVDTLRNALESELPYYMVPSLFVELDSIPLNPNGKIDKFALKNSFKEDSSIDIGDNMLKQVIEAFKDVLNLDFVLMDDDFVELGGNSLSAMKLQMLLNENLGVNLYASDVIELSTPVNIANHIKYNLDVHSTNPINYDFNDNVPLGESQLNVYLDESVKDMGTAYNNPFKITLNGYCEDEIRNALKRLSEIYPVLSARVVNDDGKPSFSFDAEIEIRSESLEVIDSFVRPFNLEKSLCRFLIVEDNILCADFHHLIVDGTSINIVFDSLFSILNNETDLKVDEGVLRQISFEENLNQDYIGDGEEFFDLMLEDRDEVYELLSSPDNDNSSHYLDIFEIDNDNLSSFLKENSITHNQFFASVFAYTLSRFTGSSKVLFNLIEDGRGHIDLSESVGMFVRTLPLLIDCRNQEISSFLKYSGGLINTAMKYDLYPFRILANKYELNSDIMFQYSHDLFNNLINNEDNAEELKRDPMGDFSFFIFDMEDERLAIRILFSEKFSKDFVKHFAESYKLVLKGMIDENELSRINYTLSSDLKTLDAYNKTENDLKYNDLLEAFNDNLEKYPDNILVSYGNGAYTFSEGAFIADKLAGMLTDLGVRSQDCISFMVERSHLYMFCALGILSVGGVYVPLDDTLPDERIKFMADDSDSKIVIVSDKTYERALNLFGENVNLLNISDIFNEDIETLNNLPIVYGKLACILYTSGTTGIPKGVKITRKGITSYVDFYVNEYGMKNDSVFGLFASIGFDVGAIRGICAPLYGGACLDIVPQDIRMNVAKLNSHFIKHGVTHTTLPTQIARMFVDEVDETSLEVLITGGEKLGEINASVSYSFVDSYGPTECCVAVCAIEEKNKIDSSSIGYLFNNVRAYILDNEKRRVPIGAVGELCIAGSQVADGYLNRPEETDKAFKVNPFEKSEDYNVLYHTGDLVRILPDGSLGIVGRSDSQVKIRGNRVELQEVEAVIRQLSSVGSVTVQTVEYNGNQELVAYVTCDDADNIEELISEHVSNQKPDYMVPSFVISLDEIPLTVNGKVDKRALPEVDRNSLHVEYAAPRNEKERDIVDAFEKAFDIEKISIHDDFSRLGGDSLIAIKLLSYLENYDITVADILKLRTPRAIAEDIDAISLDLDIYSLDSGCPLNNAQVNLFADIKLSNKFDFYHIPVYMDIPKKYGLERVLDAIDKISDVHPILAMHLSKRYEKGDDKGLSERLREDMDLFNDLKGNYEDQSLTDLLRDNGWSIRRIYNMFRTILRLFKGQYPYLLKGSKPPVEVEHGFSKDGVKKFIATDMDIYNNMSMFKVFELEDSYLLLAKFHHMIFDAVSTMIFKHDFQLLLDDVNVDVDTTFLRRSAFTHQIKYSNNFIEAGNFYDSMLSGIDESKPFIGDTRMRGYSMIVYDLDIDYDELKSFLGETGISENVLFISVFAYTLSVFTKSDNVFFAIIENGRDRYDYDSIGLFASVLPILVKCKNQSIDSFFNHSSDVIFGALKYDYYPILLLSRKYPMDITTIFQYVPEWVDYDLMGDDSEELSSGLTEDIINNLVDSLDDLIAEFIVQLFQKGENYSMMIVNSNNYSDKMVKDFKDAYVSILSNIINSDMRSDLKSTLKF